MKKDHLAESTIKVTDRRLRLIAKTVNIDNPEEILDYLARLNVKDSYKESLANAYDRYAGYNGIIWKKPFIMLQHRVTIQW